MLPISNCIAYRHTNVCFKQVLTDHCAILNLSNNENLCSVVVRVSSITTAWKTIVHCFAKGLKADQRGRCNCQPKSFIKSINLQEYLSAHIYNYNCHKETVRDLVFYVYTVSFFCKLYVNTLSVYITICKFSVLTCPIIK